MAKIKVDLITGFLGSGKTTFIKEYAEYLVRRGENVAIIVNDYGAINVDRLLLGDALGDKCHLEMVIGGDKDCARRRLKTKLIAMAMNGFSYVIVEPSGIFDVDDFLDMLYEEPLERWYEMGSILSIVEADIDKYLSEAARYILSSEVAKAGTIIISKVNGISDTDESETIGKIEKYINESLERYGCSKKIENYYIWRLGEIGDEDFEKISHSRYSSGDMIKLPEVEAGFDSLFYFHVQTNIDVIEDTLSRLFNDKTVGNIIRLKGFLQKEDGKWIEINATKSGVNISPISVGQELFIVIGENLDAEKIGYYWNSYRNGL